MYPECSGNLPPSRNGHSATTVGNKIYLFGGSGGKNYFNDLYILDTSK